MGRSRALTRLELHRHQSCRKFRPRRRNRTVSPMGIKRLFDWRSEDRIERKHDRRDLYHHAERNRKRKCRRWNGRLRTASLDAAAHDDRMAAAKTRMGCHRPQQRTIMPGASNAIAIGTTKPTPTLVAAARPALASARVHAFLSGKDLN